MPKVSFSADSDFTLRVYDCSCTFFAFTVVMIIAGLFPCMLFEVSEDVQNEATCNHNRHLFRNTPAPSRGRWKIGFEPVGSATEHLQHILRNRQTPLTRHKAGWCGSEPASTSMWYWDSNRIESGVLSNRKNQPACSGRVESALDFVSISNFLSASMKISKLTSLSFPRYGNPAAEPDNVHPLREPGISEGQLQNIRSQSMRALLRHKKHNDTHCPSRPAFSRPRERLPSQGAPT